MKTFGILALGLLVVAALLLYMCTYVTEYNEWTIVKTFGKPGPALDGREPGGAGLRFKAPLPIESVVRYDSRLRILVNEPTQVAMAGSGTILVTLNCTWRIVDPVTFLNKLDTEARGQALLRGLLNQKGQEVIAAAPLQKLIHVRSDSPVAGEKDPQEAIEADILGRLKPEAAANGIGVTTVGIQAMGFSQEITKSVIDSQKAERDAKANGIVNQGKTAKENIIKQAKLDADVVLAFAEGRAQQIRTRGIERTASMYDQFREMPELAEFLRKLRMLEKSFSENSIIYVDASMIDAVKLLYDRAALPGKSTSAPAGPQK